MASLFCRLSNSLKFICSAADLSYLTTLINALHLLTPIDGSVVNLGVRTPAFGTCSLEFMLLELAAVTTDMSPLSRLCSFRIFMSHKAVVAACGFCMELAWVA